MGNFRFDAFTALLAVGLATATSAEAAPSAEKNGETIKRVAAAYQKDDCDTVIALGVPLIEMRGGTGLPGAIESFGYDAVVSCEISKDSQDRAYAHALRGTGLEHASDRLWHLRLAMESDSKRYEAAVASVEAMSQGRGAALNSVPVRWMWNIHNALKDAGSTALRMRLLQVLASDFYAPDELYGDNDWFELRYAKELAAAGENEKAGVLIIRLRDPSAIADASVDPRLRGFVPAELDVRALAEAQLIRHREAIARDPDRLDPLIDAASDLRRLGRPQEAVELLRGVSDRVEQAGAFKDREDKLNWYWDALGRSYEMLGRYDEMVAAFTKGAQQAEESNPNVSQVINLAHAQYGLGRGDDSLRTIAVFADGRKGSPYGEMEMRLARGCANAVAGRPAEAAADLAFAREHEKDHPEALADLYLCLGDMDGAAAAFIRRLEDPDRRADALLQLSDYDDPPAARPAHPIHSRLKTLKSRPDVKAAIEKAGGTRRFRLQRGEL